MSYTLDNESHQNLIELMEDSVEFYCNEYKISGELTWLVIQSLATAKLEMFKGNVK